MLNVVKVFLDVKRIHAAVKMDTVEWVKNFVNMVVNGNLENVIV